MVLGFQTVLPENEERRGCVQQQLGPLSACGFEQETALLEKMSPRAHSSRSSYFVCLSYTTYVGKSDHVSRLSQLRQRLIRSSRVFIGCAFLQGAHVAQTFVLKRCQLWKILIQSQQVVKRRQVHGDLHAVSAAALLG